MTEVDAYIAAQPPAFAAALTALRAQLETILRLRQAEIAAGYGAKP